MRAEKKLTHWYTAPNKMFCTLDIIYRRTGAVVNIGRSTCTFQF